MNKPDHYEPPSEYFVFMAKLAKAHAARVLADIAKEEAAKAARNLAAQSDSHTKMLESFARMRRADKLNADPDAWCTDPVTQAERDEEMRREFDALEALALNAGRY